jgi:hypothetical protein
MSDDASSDASAERFSFLFRQEYLVSFSFNLVLYGELPLCLLMVWLSVFMIFDPFRNVYLSDIDLSPSIL